MRGAQSTETNLSEGELTYCRKEQGLDQSWPDLHG